MAEILQQFPQYAWAALSLGLIAIIFRLIGVLASLAQSLSRQPAPLPAPAPAPPVVPLPKPVPVPVSPPAPPLPPPAPPVPPIQTGPFAGAPAWFQLGLHDLGFHEIGDNEGIEKFIAQAHTGSIHDPWCAIWANAKLEQAGLKGSRSPSSQSFRTDPNFVELAGPALGCIVVYWRESKQSGKGHVGFYVDETATTIRTLGGNEGDMVQITPLYKNSASFGLVGFYWPASVPRPKIGAISTPAGSLAHVVTDPTIGLPAPPVPHALVDQTLIDAVKEFEGFSAKAYGDFKQYSIGYGTKASSPTEVITEPEAETRLVAELSSAAASVDKFAPNAPAGVRRALIDLTYNVGPIWEQQGLGQLIKAGNYENAKATVLQYNHAGGQVNAGLTRRREAEVAWFDSSPSTPTATVT